MKNQDIQRTLLDIRNKVESLIVDTVPEKIYSKKEIKDLSKTLSEHSTYLVEVKCNANNPEHQAILFTGFNNGSYSEVYSNSYGEPISLYSLYQIKVIKFLCKVK